MRILLLNTNQMQPPIAPIGLDYVAEALDRAGHEVTLLDLCFVEDIEAAIEQALQGDSYDLIGGSLRNTDDCYFASRDFFIPKVREMLELVRARTDAPVVLGGVGFSIFPEAILAACAGSKEERKGPAPVLYGLWGEGEWALPELARRLEAKEDLTTLPGLVQVLDQPARTSGPPLQGSRIPDHAIRNSPYFLDLATLPPPTRAFVDNSRYFREGGQAGFETKRGCDQLCIYCADPVAKSRRVRLRPLQAVVQEVEALLAQGIDHLHTCDSEFNLPETHAQEVCAALINRGLGDKIRWYAYCTPQPFSDELAGLMKRAGCGGIDFGVDHGEDGMLQRLGRNFRAADLLEAARLCRKHGLVFMFDLLLGGPGETPETLRRAVELMRQAEPDRVGLSIGVRIYPGTPLAERLVREGITSDHPALFGQVDDNPDFLAPIFYVEPPLGQGIFGLVGELVGEDERFFFADPTKADQNYNYNANEVLREAIRRGERGAYWDILRRLRPGNGLGRG